MYKIIETINISELETGRFSGSKDTVRFNNDKTEFITELRTGIKPLKDEVLISHSDALKLMQTKDWKKTENI